MLRDVALLTALYAAARGLMQHRPRRLIALVALSQAALVLVGLSSSQARAVSGALLLWVSSGLALTGLLLLYRLVEVRFGELDLRQLNRAGAAMPGLAAAFLIFGLALAGLPGTLGFAAQDLIVRGVLKAQPVVGLLVVLTAALNAVSVLRMYAALFLGRGQGDLPRADDAGRREWIAALVLLALLLLLGIRPAALVGLCSDGARQVLDAGARQGAGVAAPAAGRH